MSAQPDSTEFIHAVKEISEAFDTLCQERHEKGQKEYGVFTFLSNDVVRMMAEELADTANYCRMQFIKLMLLQTILEEELSKKSDDGETITIGIQSFKGVADRGWKK